MKIADMSGVSLGGIVGVRFSHSNNRRAVWLWQCHCGKEFYREGASVRIAVKRFGKTSCGCDRIKACIANGRKNKTHGFSHSKLYSVHHQMLRRCFNIASKDFPYYGARGITVCDEWMDISKFYDWAESSGYSEGLTLDRIEFNKNYEPSNCRWMPMSFQGTNTRRCKFLTYQGDTLTMSDWSRKTGIPVGTIIGRINRGWGIEKTLQTIPIRGRNQFAKS